MSAAGIPPFFGADTGVKGAVVEPTDSSSSLSSADIDKLPVNPASRRDLRSVPNEPLRRRWDWAA